MFDKIRKYLNKIFKINSERYLLQASFEGMSNNFNYVSPINVVKYENSSDVIFEGDVSNSVKKNNNVEVEYVDENLIGIDLIEYAQSENISEDLSNNNDDDLYEEEHIFEYDINKVDKMNNLIDYYKNNLEKLYVIPLEEIEEINFYYQKRIEKLENMVKKHRS